MATVVRVRVPELLTVVSLERTCEQGKKEVDTPLPLWRVDS
ncbi:hypothetical protein [Cyanothece sp. BG0011]|nr:hypothetical protein [Cyanothece sp. BG0011]